MSTFLRNPRKFFNLWEPSIFAFKKQAVVNNQLIGNSLHITASGGVPIKFDLSSDGRAIVVDFDLPAGITIALRYLTGTTNDNTKVPTPPDTKIMVGSSISMASLVGTYVTGGASFQFREYTSLGGQTITPVDSIPLIVANQAFTNYEQIITTQTTTSSSTPVWLLTSDVASSGILTIRDIKFYIVP